MGCTATCHGNERARKKGKERREGERGRCKSSSVAAKSRREGFGNGPKLEGPPVAWISADFGGGGGGEEAPGRPQGQQVPTHARLASLPAERRCGDARPRARAKYNVHCLPPPPPQYSSPRWNPLFSALSLN